VGATRITALRTGTLVRFAVARLPLPWPFDVIDPVGLDRSLHHFASPAAGRDRVWCSRSRRAWVSACSASACGRSFLARRRLMLHRVRRSDRLNRLCFVAPLFWRTSDARTRQADRSTASLEVCFSLQRLPVVLRYPKAASLGTIPLRHCDCRSTFRRRSEPRSSAASAVRAVFPPCVSACARPTPRD